MKESFSLSKWYAWRLTFVGRFWHLSLVIMILLWHLSLAVTFVEAKLRYLSLAVTFVEAKLWHLSLAVIFVGAKLWHLSLAVIFVEAKLWHLSLAVTFVEAMLWHLSLAVTFVEGCCDICRGLWHLVGLWHLSAQHAIHKFKWVVIPRRAFLSNLKPNIYNSYQLNTNSSNNSSYLITLKDLMWDAYTTIIDVS